MSHLKGKNVVITGGTKGIGLATARHFSEAGAKVLITGSSETSLQTALGQLSNVDGLVCDPTDMNQIRSLGADTQKTMKQVDVLFANAGIAHFRPLQEMTEQLFDEMMQVNVKGLYFSIQQIEPMMPSGSAIVVTASIAPRKGQVGLSAYRASKGAARAMVRNLAAELTQKNIRINCISPGPVETEIFSRMVDGNEEEAKKIMARIASTVPQGRVATADEIAHSVDFLCGPGSEFMLGTEITMDGGKAEL